jgi:hypothetical protein
MRQLPDAQRYLILFQLLLLLEVRDNPNQIYDQRGGRALFGNEVQRPLQTL